MSVRMTWQPPASVRANAVDEVRVADEVGDELVGRVLVDVARPGDLLDAPVVHHRDLVRQGQRFALIVGDVDSRDLELALQPFELEAHAVAQLRIEVRQRLVEQQQRRFHDERARQRETLLLAARQLRRVAIRQFLELHRVEHAHHVLANLPARILPVADLERKRRVLEHGHVRPDGIRLKHHAEPAAVGRHEHAVRRREHDAAIHRDLAGARPLESRDRPQRRRLAAAARAEQREQTPLVHREGDVLRGPDDFATVVRIFGEQPLDLQHVVVPATCDLPLFLDPVP